MINPDSLIFVACRSLKEAEAATVAIDRLRSVEVKSQKLQETSQAETELAERIYAGLTYAPLSKDYHDMLAIWFEAERGSHISVETQMQTLRKAAGQIRAMLSKLSGRMRRIATPNEMRDLRTPLMLLLDMAYDQSNSSSHRLTASGRIAVRRYLRST